MGVPGLLNHLQTFHPNIGTKTRFKARTINSQQLQQLQQQEQLEQVELQQDEVEVELEEQERNHVVVDGSAWMYYFYRTYQKLFKNYIEMKDVMREKLRGYVLKYNLMLTVLVDGAYEKRKAAEHLKRNSMKKQNVEKFITNVLQDKGIIIINFNSLYYICYSAYLFYLFIYLIDILILGSPSIFNQPNLPLFTRTILLQVLRELGIEFYVCDHEADRIISSYAQMKNCYVWSNDSDFFILENGKGYVPLHEIIETENELSWTSYETNRIAESLGLKKGLHLSLLSQIIDLLNFSKAL